MSWVLGTFNSAVFGLALLLLLYPRGGLGDALAGLSTLTGLALYVALWATSVYAAGRATRGLELLDPRAGDAFYGRALRWGGFTGVAFLVELGAILLAGTLLSGDLRPLLSLPLFIPVGFIASLVAFVAGALVGVTAGALDLAALRIAGALAERIAGDGRSAHVR